MLCTVYRLMDKGIKLSKAAAQATGAKVDFTFERHPGGQNSMQANLRRPNGGRIIWLERAEILHIKGGGIMVAGSEELSPAEIYRQRWWCVPLAEGEPDDPTEVTRKLMPGLLTHRHADQGLPDLGKAPP